MADISIRLSELPCQARLRAYVPVIGEAPLFKSLDSAATHRPGARPAL
jgi:hypothetical protein